MAAHTNAQTHTHTPGESGPSLKPGGGLREVVDEPQVEARLLDVQDVLSIPR